MSQFQHSLRQSPLPYPIQKRKTISVLVWVCPAALLLWLSSKIFRHDTASKKTRTVERSEEVQHWPDTQAAMDKRHILKFENSSSLLSSWVLRQVVLLAWNRSLWVGACNSTIFLSRRFHRLPWECDDQSQETNWRHYVTGAELPLFRKKKYPKNRSVCKNAVT